MAWRKIMGAIPVKSTPKAARRAIETAREALAAGELVCVFPERGISRSGQLQTFQPGVLEIQRGTGAPIIPGLSRRAVGHDLQFSRRTVFLEVAERLAAARVDLVRQADRRSRKTSTKCGKPCRIWERRRSRAGGSGRSPCPGR